MNDFLKNHKAIVGGLVGLLVVAGVIIGVQQARINKVASNMQQLNNQFAEVSGSLSALSMQAEPGLQRALNNIKSKLRSSSNKNLQQQSGDQVQQRFQRGGQQQGDARVDPGGSEPWDDGGTGPTDPTGDWPPGDEGPGVANQGGQGSDPYVSTVDCSDHVSGCSETIEEPPGGLNQPGAACEAVCSSAVTVNEHGHVFVPKSNIIEVDDGYIVSNSDDMNYSVINQGSGIVDQSEVVCGVYVSGCSETIAEPPGGLNQPEAACEAVCSTTVQSPQTNYAR